MLDGFVVGGGMEMLALPTTPSLVSGSAERPFRLALDDTVDGESKECEVVRDLIRGGAGTDELLETDGRAEGCEELATQPSLAASSLSVILMP